MNALFRSAPLFAALLCATTAAHAGEAFAPPGSKATLTVDYVYESVGKRSSEGMYEPHEWRARRSVAGYVLRRAPRPVARCSRAHARSTTDNRSYVRSSLGALRRAHTAALRAT